MLCESYSDLTSLIVHVRVQRISGWYYRSLTDNLSLIRFYMGLPSILYFKLMHRLQKNTAAFEKERKFRCILHQSLFHFRPVRLHKNRSSVLYIDRLLDFLKYDASFYKFQSLLVTHGVSVEWVEGKSPYDGTVGRSSSLVFCCFNCNFTWTRVFCVHPYHVFSYFFSFTAIMSINIAVIWQMTERYHWLRGKLLQWGLLIETGAAEHLRWRAMASYSLMALFFLVFHFYTLRKALF